MTEARCHECKNKCDNYSLYEVAVKMAFLGEGIDYGESIESSESNMAAIIYLIPKLMRRMLAECLRWQPRRGWQIATHLAISTGRTNEIA
jgi:hypothetical protein